jgi:hypothetical protein
MDDILIGDGGIIIDPQTSHKSALSKQSDDVELLIRQAIQLAVGRAEQKQNTPIVQTSSSMMRQLVEDFCQENPLFKEICDSIALLRKLINLQLLANIQDVPPRCLEDWVDDWITLGKKVNRATAIQLISNLPVSLRVVEKAVTPSDVDEKALKKRVFKVLLYRLTGSWLWAWEEDSNIPSDVKDYYKPFEPLAFLVEARYRLIRGLFDREKVNTDLFPRAAFAWLLSEAAFCRRLFHNKLNKDELYQCFKQYVALLSDSTPTVHRLKGLPEIIPNIDVIFDELGRQEAKLDDDFRENYFEPYTKALKRWNARTHTGKAIEVPRFEESDPPARPRKR